MKKFLNIRTLLPLSIFILHSSTNAAICHVVTSEDEFRTVISQNNKIVVEFFADWCHVCNDIAQPFEQLSQESEFSNIAFARVNIDQLDNLRQEYSIVGIPTFLYFENGKQKKQDIGVQSVQLFKDHLRTNLRTSFAALEDGLKDIEHATQGAHNQIPDEHGDGMDNGIVHQIIRLVKGILLTIQKVTNDLLGYIRSVFGR